MAKHIYYTCDRCGDKLPDNYAILGVMVERRPDAAGSMENVCEYIDLCQKCAVYALHCVMESMDYGERAKFIESLKRK